MQFFYSKKFKKNINKVAFFHKRMTTFFVLSLAITLALGMLLVPAIGTVVFAENMTGMTGNMSGMGDNMTGMTGNMTGNMTGMTSNMTG
jgi:hypothetical protein